MDVFGDLLIKNNPLVKTPEIYGASIPSLLDLLKSPEQVTRILANRELVAQKCSQDAIIQWLRSLSPLQSNYEQHLLEALWLHASLNYYNHELLMSVLRAENGKVRAAGVRMLGHYQKQKDHLGLLKELVGDVHPQVRLEAVIALRLLGSMEAIETALQVLDHPLDDNLEFAIWFLAKDLRDTWLPELLSEKKVFGGDINKQMFALLACDEDKAVNLIKALIMDNSLVDTLRDRAWLKLARLGDEDALDLVLKEAIENSNPVLLAAMANAPATNPSAPKNLALLEAALDHDTINYRLHAIRLIGRWQAFQFENKLIEKAYDFDISATERIAASRALINLDKLPEIIKLARSGANASLRATAAAVWAENEPKAAANTVVELLSNIDSLTDAELLFTTYRQMESGPPILSKALSGKTISEPVASCGLRVVQSSGLDLSELAEAIRTAGSLAPIGAQLTSLERKALLEDVLSSETTYRGRQIYRRPQLMCASCHRIDRIGGLIGPDLSTIGTYMTPNSILESLLNPSSDIKQGYETVIATKTDGQVISGTLYRKTDSATLIRIPSGEIISIPNEELEKTDVSSVSLMPAGLTASLHRDELKDLLIYLVNLGAKE